VIVWDTNAVAAEVSRELHEAADAQIAQLNHDLTHPRDRSRRRRPQAA